MFHIVPTFSEAQDAVFARGVAEEEVASQRRAELDANARAWDAHYRFLFMYIFFKDFFFELV